MRNFYFHLVIGFIFLVAAIVSAVSENIPMVVLYFVVGGAFLYSAYSIWKKEKNNRGR